jgi:hypothetical protein
MALITIKHGKKGFETTLNVSSIVAINIMKGTITTEFRAPFSTRMVRIKHRKVTNLHEIVKACEDLYISEKGEIITDLTKVAPQIHDLQNQMEAILGFNISIVKVGKNDNPSLRGSIF